MFWREAWEFELPRDGDASSCIEVLGSLLGGMAAEMMRFGTASAAAQADLKQAEKLANACDELGLLDACLQLTAASEAQYCHHLELYSADVQAGAEGMSARLLNLVFKQTQDILAQSTTHMEAFMTKLKTNEMAEVGHDELEEALGPALGIQALVWQRRQASASQVWEAMCCDVD